MPEMINLATLENLIPKPASVERGEGFYTLAAATQIFVEAGNAEVAAIATFLAEKLRTPTGYPFQVVAADSAPENGIYLSTNANDPALGGEGYLLDISNERITLTAHQPEGLFRGIQTIRQLLPPRIESSTRQAGPWRIPAGVVRDTPRFPWRGVMLDVARHFFSVQDVKRYIDLLAYYKLNRFHLHLSDDQGWRLEIHSWPKLATYGGSTAVNGDPGGYYTQADYAEIVQYAAQRYITVVPEIDTPGHTNAALAAYPELNCDGPAPELYTGIEVGFSTLCINQDLTYKFLDDVIGEIAAITPGPYIHIGGDEAAATPKREYIYFIEKIQQIVASKGKQMVGWEEVSQVKLNPDVIVQQWKTDQVRKAADQGLKIIASPATRAYLDMKYDANCPLGLNWAGYVEVKDAYAWDPATETPGVTEKDLIGIEAPLWSETLLGIRDIEFMVFPRLVGLAEIGWSPATGRNWDEYKLRLGAHGLYLKALYVNFYKSTQVPWR